jgi:hypothetical protein
MPGYRMLCLPDPLRNFSSAFPASLMHVLPPLILEDWEDYLTRHHPEQVPALPFRVLVEVESWPHEVATLFQRATPPRPYPHQSGSNPDEYRRMLWALNGMRSYLVQKLEALIQTCYAASELLPAPGDEFIIQADERSDRSWGGLYVLKKRIMQYSATDGATVAVRLIISELEWEDGVTGFSHES